jgi:hypothetical protein
MNMKDSIELAEKLSKDYSDLEKVDQEISDKEKILDTPVSSYQEPAQDVSLFETGILVIFKVIAFFFVLGIDGYIYLMSFAMDWDEHTRWHQSVAWAVILISNIGLIALIIFVKHRREKNTRKYLEEQRIKQAEFARQRRAELREELAGLNQKRAEISEGLAKYDSQIPREFRSRYHMVKVKMMLQNGKAQSFDEAVGLLVQTAQ